MQTQALSFDDLSDDGVINPLAALELSYSEFISEYGSERLHAFEQGLKQAGFVYRGTTQENSAIYAYPSDALESIFFELSDIIDQMN